MNDHCLENGGKHYKSGAKQTCSTVCRRPHMCLGIPIRCTHQPPGTLHDRDVFLSSSSLAEPTNDVDNILKDRRYQHISLMKKHMTDINGFAFIKKYKSSKQMFNYVS